MVMRDPPYPDSMKNLHFVWDAMPGEFKSEAYASIFARGLRADPKYAREKLKDALAVKDFAAWANESHALAIEKVYLNGKLIGTAKSGRADGGPTTRRSDDTAMPGLSREYMRCGAGRCEANRAGGISHGGFAEFDL